MKKIQGFSWASLLVVVFLICALAMPFAAQAGQPFTETVTLGAATGTGSWTNTTALRAAKLVSVEVFNNLNATNQVTVKRDRSGRTNNVCTVTCASGAGIYNEVTNTVYLFSGDKLNFSSLVATGATVELVFETTP